MSADRISAFQCLSNSITKPTLEISAFVPTLMNGLILFFITNHLFQAIGGSSLKYTQRYGQAAEQLMQNAVNQLPILQFG